MADAKLPLKHVMASLQADPRINLHRYPVRVRMLDGAVLLEGEVDSVRTKKRALGHAASVEGIRGVVDRLRIQPALRRGDGAIRDALLAALGEEREFANCAIRYCDSGRIETFRDPPGERSGDILVDVQDGVIALEGMVISLSHKRVAGVLAWWTLGCRDVLNSLVVDPHEDDNGEEVVEALRIVLEMDPSIDADQITAHCANFVVTLEGYVATEAQSRRAELDAWSLFAVDDVINRIDVQS
jgi:osmotically-inducible protein OsmY